MPYDSMIIVCYRSDNPKTLIVPGASKTRCEKCQFEVWIAPSSRKIRQEQKAKVLCNICYHSTIDKEIFDIVPLNNEQITEIKDGLWNRKTRN